MKNAVIYGMEIKPPVKPGKNATQKELAAYHSQLRRWARTIEERETRLRKIEQLLAAKETLLEKRERLLDDMAEELGLDPDDPSWNSEMDGEDGDDEDDEDEEDDPRVLECGCSVYDAKNGCECPECEQWRKGTGMPEDDLADMDVCKFDEWIASDGTEASPMNDEEAKFFARYEKQMKVK